jgi:hypothetical protein
MIGLRIKSYIPWLSRLWLVTLYLACAVLWGKFFNWGKIPFDFHDWAEINAARLEYLRNAVIEGTFPLHASETAHLRNLTDRLFSIPDFIFTPQAVLMRWIDVGTFVLVNTLLLYSLSFLGLLWFRREYHLSLVLFSILVLLFNFNGHIIAHFSVGHITWWGTFLFPLFFVQVFRYLKGIQSWAWVTETSLLLFFMFLQGGYHQYTWCLLFLGILGLANWRRFSAILKVLVFANLLTAVRLLPPVLLLGKFDTETLSGYPFPWQILQAMLFERLPQQAMPFQNFNSGLGYWEFDLYVGYVGSAFIGLGVLLWIVNSIKTRSYTHLIVPMAVLTVFSIRNFYQLIAWLPIPLLAAERVPSRMLFLPYSLAMILAAITFQVFINDRKKPLIGYILCLIGLIYIALDLNQHALHWQVAESVLAFPVTPVNLSIKTLANHHDPPYTAALIIGGIISLLTFVVLLTFSWREKRRMDPKKSSKNRRQGHSFFHR